MVKILEESSFFVWLPELASDPDERSYCHVRVTRKDKFKFKKSAALFFTEEKGRFLVEAEKSFKYNDREMEDLKSLVTKNHDLIVEMWSERNGEPKYK